MTTLGERLGPTDPHELAKSLDDGKKLPSALSVTGFSPTLAFTIGTLVALAVVFTIFPGQDPRSGVDGGTPRVGSPSDHRMRDLVGAAQHIGGSPVSDTYPPGPSVPGPQEPAQPATPEYLEAGGGSPLPPAPPAPASSGGGRRRGLLIGGGVAALAVVGVGAWAAAQFFSTGAQPAEALPAGTLGYASIDLDPSGGQKIEALRTLNKFPAFKDEIGLDTDDDIRAEALRGARAPEELQGRLRRGHRAVARRPVRGRRGRHRADDPGDRGRRPGHGRRRGRRRAGKLRDCANEGDTDGGRGRRLGDRRRLGHRGRGPGGRPGGGGRDRRGHPGRRRGLQDDHVAGRRRRHRHHVRRAGGRAVPRRLASAPAGSPASRRASPATPTRRRADDVPNELPTR